MQCTCGCGCGCSSCVPGWLGRSNEGTGGRTERLCMCVALLGRGDGLLGRGEDMYRALEGGERIKRHARRYLEIFFLKDQSTLVGIYRVHRVLHIPTTRFSSSSSSLFPFRQHTVYTILHTHPHPPTHMHHVRSPLHHLLLLLPTSTGISPCPPLPIRTTTETPASLSCRPQAEPSACVEG